MPDADLILRNANVITMDADCPAARSVAVSGDRVLAVGDKDLVGEVRGAKTKVIDCGGKTIVPGFNDAHCHFFGAMAKRNSLDFSPGRVKSIADIKAALRQRAETAPPGNWIAGSDYHQFNLAEKRHPHRYDLDEAAPDHPVVLFHRSLHVCVLNSRGLALAGITKETPEPSGAVIERELETGEPNGRIFEMVGYIRQKVLPALIGDELAAAVRVASEHCLSRGITSFQEASMGNGHARWELLKGFKDSGELKCRVSMMCGFESLPEFKERGMAFGCGDAGLRLGGMKIILTETKGSLQPPLQELKAQALAAHEAGFQLAVHCIEPSAVAAALETLEYIDSRSSIEGRRHRLEHVSECPPELLKRLQNLKAMVVTQPVFIYQNGDRYLASVAPERQRWLYRIGAWVKAGLTVAGSSDAPVADDNPLIGIYSAATRRTEAGQQLLPDEAVSVPQALAMYTRNAAYASFEENIKGSISPGKLADLVVLSADPLRSAPEELKDIGVEMTVVGGEVVWEV